MNGFTGFFRRLYQAVCQAFTWMVQAVYSFANLQDSYQAPTDLPFSYPNSPQVRIQTATPRLSSDRDFARRLAGGPPRQLHLPQRVSARESLELESKHHDPPKPTHAGRNGQLPFLKKKASSISVASIHREPTGSSAGTPNTGFLSPTFSAHRTSTTSLTSIESPAISHSPASRHKPSLSDGAQVSMANLPSKPHTISIELGGLARRRGFKGSPLLTSQTSLGDSLRSLSPTISPRASRAMTLLSPRSSMEAVTNIIRNGKATSQEKEPEVPPETQDAFDAADPFALGGNSFYEPGFAFGDVPKSTVQDLEVYEQAALAQEPNLKKKNRLSNLRSSVTSVSKAAVATTTIYDLTIADLPLDPTSLRVPGPCVASSSGLPPPPRSPKILVTSPSAHSTSARTDNSTCSADMNTSPSSAEAKEAASLPRCETEKTSEATCTQDFVPCLPPTVSFDENDDLLGGVLGNKRASREPLSVLRDVGNVAVSSQSTVAKTVLSGNEMLKESSAVCLVSDSFVVSPETPENEEYGVKELASILASSYPEEAPVVLAQAYTIPASVPPDEQSNAVKSVSAPQQLVLPA